MGKSWERLKASDSTEFRAFNSLCMGVQKVGNIDNIVGSPKCVRGTKPSILFLNDF